MNRIAKIDKCLERFIDEKLLIGCGMTMSVKNQLIYNKCFGAADAEGSRALTQDTRVRCYSLSKTFTVAGFMQLYEKGLFTLDTPISKYLPEFSNPVVCADPQNMDKTVPADRPITIRHLLTMTSGIPYLAFTPLEGAVQDAIAGELMQMVQGRKKPAKDLSELVKMIASYPLCYQPGEHWLYGFSHTVIGRLIEVITGKTIRTYLEENIWKPLGLNSTCFNSDVPENVQVAEQIVSAAPASPLGRNKTDSPSEETKTEWIGIRNDESPTTLLGIDLPCGSIVSTLKDLGVFYAMLANQGQYEDVRILEKSTIDLMRKNRLGAAQLETFNSWDNNRGFGYGLGVRTMMDFGEAGFYVPEGSFGWDGASGCYALANPEEGLSFVFVEQSMPHHISETIPRLMAAAAGIWEQ